MSTSAAKNSAERKRSLSNNIGKNQELNVPSGLFMLFFGEALIKHYSQEQPSCVKQKK